jgi:hypothetical protein
MTQFLKNLFHQVRFQLLAQMDCTADIFNEDSASVKGLQARHVMNINIEQVIYFMTVQRKLKNKTWQVLQICIPFILTSATDV